MGVTRHTNTVESHHPVRQSVGSKIISGGVICGLAILLIFLLGNVLLYFFDRSQALLQRDTQSGTQRYSLAGLTGTGTGADGQILIPLTTNSTTNGTDLSNQVNRAPSSTQVVTSGGGTTAVPYYVPMTYFIPQQTGGQSGPIIFNHPGNPGGGSTNTTTNTTSGGGSTSTTDVDYDRSLVDVSRLSDLVNTGNLDPAISPAILNDLTLPTEVLSGDVAPTLPDNILYPLVEFNRTIDNALTLDPLGKTYNYLEQSNMKTLEGLVLLEKNTGDDTDKLAVDTFKGATKLVKEAGKSLENSKLGGTDATVVLLNGMSNQLIVQQILLQAAENIDANLIALEIEKVRLDHLAEVGVIVDRLLSVSNNDADVLTNLITGSMDTPVEALHTLNILNDLENTVGVDVRPTVSLVEQTVAAVLVQELVALPKEDQLNAVLGFTGNSPIRLIQAIETLDLLPVTENQDVRNIARAASDIAVNKLERTLTTLPVEERTRFLKHFSTGELEDIKKLVVMEAHLKKALTNLEENTESNKLVQEIASVKKDALEKYTAKLANVKDISDSQFVQRLMRQPDIYDVSLLNAIENVSTEKIKNADVIAALNATRFIALTKLVSDLDAGRTELPMIPYSGALLADIDNDLTPQANKVITKALNAYQKDMGQYLINEVGDKEILSRYEEQLRTVSSPVSSLANPVSAKVENNIVQPVVQNIVPQIVNQPIIQSNPVVIPAQPSVQETIQQVPQVVNNVTDQVLPQEQSQTQPETQQSLPQKVINILN